MVRQRIVENINLAPDSYFRKKEDLRESTIVVAEANASSAYKALAVYTFPISRPDQRNLNNRIYTSQLWENVIRSGKAEGTFGLMDHPESDGSVKDIWCVWRNLRFSADRKLILCDAYLFGKWGQQVLEALEAGGKVGLSSSGWGEFLEDNTTLDPNTYEIERPADFVLNPSYEVFGVQDDLVESISREQNIMESTLEVSPKEKIEENTMDNDVKKTSPSLEERTFELNMKSMFKEAKKIEDVPSRIKESKSLLGYFEGHESSLKSEIEESIKADEEAILEGYRKYVELSASETKNEETVTEVKELKESVNSLTEKVASLEEEKKALSAEKESLNQEFENACTLLDSMKEYSEKQEEMIKIANAKSNGMISASDYKESIVYGEELEEENKNLKKTISELRRRVKSLLEASEEDDDEEEDDEEEDDEDEKKASNDKETDKDDDEEEDEDDEEEDKKESYSIYKGLNPEVVSYYEDLEYMNPKVVQIKKEILSKHTLIEAQKTYLKLRALIEDRDTKLYKSGKKTYVESVKKTAKPIHEGWV